MTTAPSVFRNGLKKMKNLNNPIVVDTISNQLNLPTPICWDLKTES